MRRWISTLASPHIYNRRTIRTTDGVYRYAIATSASRTDRRNSNKRYLSTKPASAQDETKLKPWLDAKIPLDDRVNEFLKARKIHKADFHALEMKRLLEDCCKKGSLEGMEEAHSILERLYVEKRNEQKLDPASEYSIDQSFVNTVLFGWVNLAKRLRVAQVRMRELLDTAIDEVKHDVKVNPSINSFGMITVQTFNTYLQGLANASVNNPQAAIAAEATLYEMDDLHRSLQWQTKPNTRSYGLVIHAFSRTRHRNAGDRALNVLRRLQQQYQVELKAYEQKFGTPYIPPTDFGPKQQNNKHQIAAPDTAIYTSCMNALLEYKPDRAIRLLEEAIDANIPLDGGVFVLPMNGLARKIEKEGNAKRRIALAETAEALLEQMILVWKEGKLLQNPKDEMIGHEGAPIQIGFNACLDVWSRAFCKEGPLRCEALLHTMIDGSHDIQPTTWSKAHKFHPDSTTRAITLLELQWELSKEVPAVTPDFQTYTIVINSIAKSSVEDKLSVAFDLLEELVQRVANREMDISRNPSGPFVAVLGVISRLPPIKPGNDGYEEAIESKSDPYSIATEVYQQIKDDAQGMGLVTDHHAISAYLRCIAAHSPEESTERQTNALLAFDEACELGQVSRLVVDAMDNVFGEKLVAMVPELKTKNYPRLWSRNVVDKFR